MRLLLVGIICVIGAANVHAQQSFRLGYVKNPEGTDSVWLAGTPKKNRTDDKVILSYGYGGKININGQEIKLEQVKEYLPDRNFTVGHDGYVILHGKDVRARLDYVFTWLCPKDDEQCEVYYYSGVLNVTYRGIRRKFKVTGFGGS